MRNVSDKKDTFNRKTDRKTGIAAKSNQTAVMADKIITDFFPQTMLIILYLKSHFKPKAKLKTYSKSSKLHSLVYIFQPSVYQQHQPRAGAPLSIQFSLGENQLLELHNILTSFLFFPQQTCLCQSSPENKHPSSCDTFLDKLLFFSAFFQGILD